MKNFLCFLLLCCTVMFIFSCQKDSDLVNSNSDPNIVMAEWGGVEFTTYSENKQFDPAQSITFRSGNNITLTMDELPTQPINNLSISGVNFGFTLNGLTSTDANYNSSGPGVGFCWDARNIEGNANGIMSISFDTPTPSVAFSLIMSTGASLSPGFTITYKDVSGTVIEVIPVNTSPLTGSPFTAACYSYESTECIKSLEIDFNFNGRFAFDNLTFELSCDADGDGCNDNVDPHPNSNMEDTVTIEGCDSGVANVFPVDCSTMSDLIGDCAAAANNHGAFVKCVADLTNEWVAAGLISGAEKGAIVSCAAKSNIGK